MNILMMRKIVKHKYYEQMYRHIVDKIEEKSILITNCILLYF